jgi:hypothetical protein
VDLIEQAYLGGRQGAVGLPETTGPEQSARSAAQPGANPGTEASRPRTPAVGHDPDVPGSP